MRGVIGEGGALVVRRVLHLEVPRRAALLAQVLLDRRPVVAHAPRAHLGRGHSQMMSALGCRKGGFVDTLLHFLANDGKGRLVRNKKIPKLCGHRLWIVP